MKEVNKDLNQQEYDIAIIGMGPVGACAAIHLAHAGMRVAVFEKNKNIYPLPRAVSIDGEIVRAFQGINRGEELAKILQTIRPDDRAGFADAQRNWLFGTKLSSDGPNGWPHNSQFYQPELDQYLRDTAQTYPDIDIFLGEEIQSWTQADERVDLKSSQRTICSRYAIACDGASSPTRKALEISWRDLGYSHDWLVVDAEVNSKNTLPNDVLQVCDPDRLHTFVATKDPFRRWEFRLNPGEKADDMMRDKTIHSLLSAWTPRASYEIRRKAVYQFHAAVAQKWRIGNIFLAGDAAHQMPPFIGQGMNTGLRDVLNLSWKLSLVIDGKADDSLLDTYEEERLPHAEDLVEWSVTFGNLMEHLAETEAAKRAGKEPPEAPKKQKSAGYGQGRHIPPLRSGLIRIDQVSNDGSTGYLMNQPKLRTKSGIECWLDNLIKDRFALLTSRTLDLDRASLEIIERLNLKVLNVGDFEVLEGHFDKCLRHEDCLLARPDRYVYGHSTKEVSPNQLINDLGQSLRLKT